MVDIKRTLCKLLPHDKFTIWLDKCLTDGIIKLFLCQRELLKASFSIWQTFNMLTTTCFQTKGKTHGTFQGIKLKHIKNLMIQNSKEKNAYYHITFFPSTTSGFPPGMSGQGYLWQVHDEVVGIGFLSSLDYIFHCCIFSAITNIVCNGGGEQNGLLLHYPNLSSKPLNVKSANVMAIQSHLENMSTSHLLESFSVLNHNTMLCLTWEEKMETYKIVTEIVPLIIWLFI